MSPIDMNIIIEDSEEAHLERLGRQRPLVFKSAWQEIGFCFALVMSQFITEYFISGFTVIVPTITRELDIPTASITWPASAFSLVMSTFLLPFGRAADKLGGYYVYIAGCAWYCVWSLIAGFAQSELMLDFCRALQGLGPAAFLPASVLLLGSTYRPGPRKNIVFSVMGAMAPMGFFAGILFAGIAGQYTTWRWYFFVGTISVALVTLSAVVYVPSDHAERMAMDVKMDWLGAATISGGIILFVFAITAASHAPNGWTTSYVLATLVLGVILLGFAVYVEGWVASAPLLPFDIFAVKSMMPLAFALLLSFGSLGVFLLYATFYMEEIMAASPIQLVAWYVPFGPGACIVAILGGYILHVVPGTIMIIIAGIAWIVAPLLFALAPRGATYWAWVFPSMICATLAVDTTISITTIFISTSMPKHRQGLAGAFVNSLMQLGIALLLGVADVVVTQTEDQGRAKSYKNAFWLEIACAGVALIILVTFVKVDAAKSQAGAEELDILTIHD